MFTLKVLSYEHQVSRCQQPMGSVFSSRLVLLHFRLGISLQACLLQIVGYRNLIADVEKLRREPYDSDNPQHEEMLLKVSPSLLSANGCQALKPATHLCTGGTKMDRP